MAPAGRERRIDERHWALVTTPVGEQWSGRTRYAAAMDFYKAGLMDAETLEIYRICARIDEEDPLDVLRRYHVGDAWMELVEERARRSAEP
jgi:hypothetical protein